MGELLEKDLVYRVVGCAMRVHGELGFGLREKTYERALCIELAHQAIAFDQQSVFPVVYRDQVIDEFVPDLDVESRLLTDTKTIEKITDLERGQMINYLHITGRKVGLIVNFKKPSLEWERIVLSAPRIRVHSRPFAVESGSPHE